MKIFPTILETTVDKALQKIESVKDIVDTIQLDIVDNVLFNGVTYQEVDWIDELDTKLKIELHLLVSNPLNIVNKKLKNVQIIYFQIETLEDKKIIIQRYKDLGYEVGISIAPDTSLKDIKEYINAIELVQFVTVTPGGQGRPFDFSVLEKIKEFKHLYPNKYIQVDGSVNETTIPHLVSIGIDSAVVGSALLQSKDIKQTYTKLTELAKERIATIMHNTDEKKKIKRIGFLGGADLDENTQEYKNAYETARLLSQNGYEIMNGGGPGIMKAATLGAKAGIKNEVIAVTYHTAYKHKNYEGTDPENTFDDEILTVDYFDRTKVMLQNTDVHIVFKGGTGTISEFGMTWASSRIHEGHNKPIILFGDFWNNIIECFKQNMAMRPGEIELLHICTTPQEVLQYVLSIDR